MIGLILRKELREFAGTWRRPSSQVLWSAGIGATLAFFAPIGAALLVLEIERTFPAEAVFLGAFAAALTASSFGGFFFPLAIGPDMVAGERERHTLETLLAGPVPEGSIAGGKVFAMILSASAAAALSALFGWAGLTVSFGVKGLAWGSLLVPGAAVAVLPAAFFMACLSLLLSMRAKSVRAAQQAIGFALVALFMLPLFVTLFVGPQVLDHPRLAITVLASIASLQAIAFVAVPVLAFTRFTRARLFA